MTVILKLFQPAGLVAASGTGLVGLLVVRKLPATATLASVHAQLLEQHVVSGGSKYELRTAFPARVLTEPSRTLEALGLAPSATLCVRLAGQ